MSERGKFIVFEGIGGCGKGTQLENLNNYLTNLNKKVIVGCEHTRDTPLGILVEDIIKKRKEGIDPTALQLLFVSDRANHTEKIIKPGLKRCDFFLEDRYRGSTISYAVPEMREYFLNVNEGVTINPHLVLIIDLDPVEAAKRVGKRGDADIFDTAKKLNVCRDGYKWYSENSKDPCVWIDGNGTKEEVFERIKNEIQRRKII
jgi:dTMP kinase